MPVASFVSQYHLAGKTVLPIVTHGGSGAGDTMETLRPYTDAEIPGAPLTVYSSDVPAARQAVVDYLAGAR